MDEFSVPSSSSTTTASAVAQQQPQPTSPCAQLVHILMCYCQGGENPEFIRKAIESLVKKLKERREQLDALISAITSGGKQQTCCVTIHRSLDGRLQVAGRKGVPNVVYARIWRWPTVSKTELVKLPICTTPAEHPDLICINPYHYDRIVSSGLVGLETPSPFRMESLPSTSSTHFNDTTAKLECHQPQEFDPKIVQEHPQYEGNYSMGQYPSNQPNFVLSHHACGNNIGNSAIENNFSIQQNEWDGNQQNATMFNPVQLHQDQTNPKAYHLPSLHSHPTHWCSINYFELDTQIGETFKAPWTMLDVHIDGGMDPTGAEAGRFCLGALSNVHRSEASERARLHIGKGIRLSMDAEGNAVFLECLSQKGIFVQSYFLDHQHNLQPGTAVHKFCTGTHRKVFDLQWAYAEMCAQKQNAHLAAMVQAYAVAGISQSAAGGSSQKSPTGMDDLRRACCTISLSFVKGWGAGYARTSIKETPCWIEIQLHRPLQLLNELLLMN